MRIAVTGGSGFLGKATIAAAVRAGHVAWSFDRQHGNDVLGPLDDLKDADTVIHLAGMLGTAELFDSPYTAVDVNVNGTLKILGWCREHGARYVGITMPPVFPSIYTATKICASRLATAYHHAYGLKVSHVRAFNAYGPGQAHGHGHPQKILPTFATEAWAGRPIPIWGSGEQLVDLVHADDVGSMLVDAARFGQDQVFDAGTSQPVTVNALANFVLRVTGSDAGVVHLAMRTGEKETAIRAEGEGWNLLSWKPELNWGSLRTAINSYENPLSTSALTAFPVKTAPGRI
jgi:UDP-glucose 4-epimerase